jgi:prepilin-type N-terminal cleavage/methylation domain-containing protein
MNHAPRSRAFSLLEVLLALALSTLLAGLAFLVLSSLTDSKRLAQAAADDQRAIGLFFDRLEDDLAAAVASDTSSGSGIVGASSSLTILSRGVGIPTDPSLGEQAARDQLSDLRGTRFTLDAGLLLASRWIGPTPTSTAPSEPIAKGLADLRFRYYGGPSTKPTWSDTYNASDADSLPLAVEVSVWSFSKGPALTNPDDPGSRRPPDRSRLIAIPDAAP